MSRRTTIVSLALLMTASALRAISAAPHPHYDDGGAVNWKASWALALSAARQTGKPIFIEAGIEN
jgi:hypothetical protein